MSLFKFLPSKIKFFLFNINYFLTIWAIQIFYPTFIASFYTPLITIYYVLIWLSL